MRFSKPIRRILSIFLIVALLGSCFISAVSASEIPESSGEGTRTVNANIVIDDNASGGYEGDYVVIYNPATSYSTSYSTGNMSGLISTSVNTNVETKGIADMGDTPYIIDIDQDLEEIAQAEEASRPDDVQVEEATRASYSVGSTKTFSILSSYSPTGSGSVQFKCLYVGQHCYIWTPTSSASNTYPLDTIDTTYAKKAADEFDSKFDLMQASFGNHTNGTSGDGKLHMLYYNIEDGWQPGQGYVAGFFYRVDITNNGLPILNIDTYPGVYYKNSSGVESKQISGTYNTMVHEYQHLINYSNTSSMSSWMNECFSAAAEEICYPGSSVIGRIQSWENYSYSTNGDWLNPPKEFKYTSSYNLHNGYSMYNWNNNLSDVLALYGQVSLFAQYLYSRFGNAIYKQISQNFTSSEPTAITNATGVNCADLVRDFRIALTANAAQDQYNGRFGFKAQTTYNPSDYHNVQNPYSLLGPIVFTGTSCSIQGGGAITVKPVNGVYYPPSDASANLKYYGIKLGTSTPAPSYTVTAVSNNTNYGTVSISGNVITATPKTGYYAAGYTVTSGTASVTQDGNTFTVTPSSNCTVRIDFAEKTKVTITCIANGSVYTTLTPYSGEAFYLPSTAPAVNGYSFAGWCTKTVAETATKPNIYSAGAYVSTTTNVTVYAVYTRTEGGSGVSGYQLLTSAPSNWAGNYVITNTNTSSLYVLTAMAPTYEGGTIESSSNSTAIASTGMTLADNVLTDVDNSYVFTIASNGSGYSVMNASNNYYLGHTSSGFLGAYSSFDSSLCTWTPAINASGVARMENAAGGTYPYLGFSSYSSYFWTAKEDSADALLLWKQTQGGTTYYTTDPIDPSTQLPTITSQPASASVAVGETVTFHVAATGENLSYQWQYKKSGDTSWTDWAGKTSATLSFKGVTSSNGCQYRCVVTNAAGSVTSSAATLTVTAALPTITSNPVSASVAVGQTVTFKVVASGSNLSYQWQYKKAGATSWTDWAGKTSATLSFKGVATSNGCQYRCVVTNAAGSVTSSAATLTVATSSLATISTQPKSASVAVGQTVSFKVVASGSNLSYQWQYKKVGQSTWTNWAGKTSATLSFKGVTTSNGCQYRCVVSNDYGTVTSSVATLTVSSNTNNVILVA